MDEDLCESNLLRKSFFEQAGAFEKRGIFPHLPVDEIPNRTAGVSF